MAPGAVASSRMGPLDLLPYDPPDRSGREPARNALVELHNVVAAAESVADFGPDDRRRIASQRGVDLDAGFLRERIAVYDALLTDALADGALLDADRERLAHVAATLGLSAGDLRGVHRSAFGAAVELALADDGLSVDERLHLYTLQHTLGLDARVADGAYDVLAREHLLRTVAQVLSDGELTDDEAARLVAMQADLSVTIPPRVHAMLDAAWRRWQLRTAPLPTVDAPVRLRSGERAHAVVLVGWRRIEASALRFTTDVTGVVQKMDAAQARLVRLQPANLRGMAPAQAIVTGQRVRFFAPDLALVDIPMTSVYGVTRFANAIALWVSGDRVVLVTSDTDEAALATVLWRLVHDGTPMSRG